MNSVPPACVQREAPEPEIVNLPAVTDGSCSALALIIDHDLGFLMWLGEVFLEAGCHAVPALHCRRALAMAKKLKPPITTLVINPELPGAARTIKTLAAANPDMRVVLIRNSPAQAEAGSVRFGLQKPSGIQARSTLERPSPWEPISRPAWVSKIRKMLALGSIGRNR